MNGAILLIFLFPLALAATFLFRGIRGYRVGDHPFCRRCGFDLYGTPAGATVCGECGANVKRRGSVVIGHRQRQPRLIAAGLIIAVPLLFVAGFIAWGHLQSINWITYSPTSWLISQASSADPVLRTPALAELLDRSLKRGFTDRQWKAVINTATAYDGDVSKPWDTGWGDLMQQARAGQHLTGPAWKTYLDTLANRGCSVLFQRRSAALAELNQRCIDGAPTAGDLATAIQLGLKYQADQTLYWDSAWGDFLENAYAKAQLSDAQWKQYLTEAWRTAPEFKLRSRVCSGDELPYQLSFKNCRTSANPKLGVRVRIDHDALQWTDVKQPTRRNSGNYVFTSSLGGNGYFGSSLPAIDFSPNLIAGVQHVHLRATVEVGPENFVTGEIKPVIKQQIDLPGTFTLVSSTQPTVNVIKNPALATEIRQAITVDSVELPKGNRPRAEASVTITNPPVALAFDVLARVGGAESNLGSIACPACSTGSCSFAIGGDWTLGNPGKADIVFRSNPTVARNTVDMVEAWEGEILFKDVPVK